MAVLLLFVGGCVGGRGDLNTSLLSNPAATPGIAPRHYHVHCPDVLQIAVQGRGSWQGPRRVGADGRIDLEDAGRLRVDGLTPPAIARLVADAVNVPPSQVQVAVAEFNSQQVYVHGEVQGAERAVPYRGPETVVELLQRIGGLSPDAAPRDIQVVRGNVADGGTPEIYQVDLEAILGKNDPRTNVYLQPFDQVYVGQSRGGCLAHALPPCLRPIAEALCGKRKSSVAAH